MSEFVGGSPELKTSFEDNILHVDNGKMRLHVALASGEFDVRTKRDLLEKDPTVNNDLINGPHHLGGGADLIVVGDVGEVRTIGNLLKTGNPSEAGYCFIFKKDGVTVYLQFIGPNSVSSHHRHHVIEDDVPREHFFHSQQRLFLWVDQKNSRAG